MTQRSTLVLDPGHGGTTTAGASTPNRGIAPSGLFEKDLALDVAVLVRDRLRDHHTVVLTREQDVNLSLAERAAAARRVEADYFVSLHFSGTPDGGPAPSAAVVARQPSLRSSTLARQLIDRLGGVTGATGSVHEADLGQIATERHLPKTAACLLEIASLDDPGQAARLADPGYRSEVADAIAAAILDVASEPAPSPLWAGSRLARASAIVEPDIDYRATSIWEAGAIWLDWFRRYGQWSKGVPDDVLRYFPHAAICQLRLYDTNGRGPAYGTGFYIADEVLLTCGHNFHLPSRNWQTARVEVQPAYSPNMSVLPSKSFSVNAQSVVHPRWWSTQDRGFDLAVLRVPGLPATAGAFSLPNISLEPSAHIVVCGYGKVAGSDYDAQGQRMDGATITNVEAELAHYPIQTIGGHSGSPVFHETMVVAVHTGPRLTGPSIDPELGRDPHENRGVLLTPDKVDWIVGLAGPGTSIGLGGAPRSGGRRAVGVALGNPDAEARRARARRTVPTGPGFAVVTTDDDEQLLTGRVVVANFDVNSAELKPEMRSALADVAQVLNSSPHALAYVEGRASQTGPDQVNEELSGLRAEAAAQELLRLGVDASKIIEVFGLGAADPLVDHRGHEEPLNRSITVHYQIPLPVRVKTQPPPARPQGTTHWSVRVVLSGSAGHAGIGGAGALVELKNRDTGQKRQGYFIGGGIGVGLQSPGADPGWGDWEDFETDRRVTFDDFDGTLSRLTMAGAGVALLGYTLAYLSFPTLGANSIPVGGWNMGAVGADASTNVGYFALN